MINERRSPLPGIHLHELLYWSCGDLLRLLLGLIQHQQTRTRRVSRVVLHITSGILDVVVWGVFYIQGGQWMFCLKPVKVSLVSADAHVCCWRSCFGVNSESCAQTCWSGRCLCSSDQLQWERAGGRRENTFICVICLTKNFCFSRELNIISWFDQLKIGCYLT